MGFRKISFGTDGWRAVTAKEFTVENVLRISKGVAAYVKKQSPLPKVVIAYDTRFGGKLFSESLALGLIEEGVHVYMDDHFLTTPILSYATRALQCDLGIMFTASHNPPSYQGLKLKSKEGGPAGDEVSDEIMQNLADKVEFPSDKAYRELSDHSLYGRVDLEHLYSDHLIHRFNLDHIRKSQQNFVFDAMNGSGQAYFQLLFPEMDCIRVDDNPTFNGVSPEPIHKNLAPLSKALQKGNYQLGLAVDGDADRIGLMDSKGGFIDAHHVMLLLIHYLVAYKKQSGKVVTGFSSSQKIKALCRHYGLELEIVKIGFKHASKRMLTEDVLVAGEEAGGISTKGHIPERDGIWNILIFMEMLQNTKKSIEELLKEIEDLVGSFSYQREDILMTEEEISKAKQKLSEKEYTKIESREVDKFENLDGWKYYLNDDEWLMFRASGTEPLLRIYAEGKNENNCQDLIQLGKDFLGI